jgi:hypothetical protein
MRTSATKISLMVSWLAGITILIGGCGFLNRLACIGDPAPLGAAVEPETLTVAPGATAGVEVTVSGLSERCFPQSALITIATDAYEGISAEPLAVTATEPTGTLEIEVANDVPVGTYHLDLQLSGYPYQPAALTLLVEAP